MILIKSDFYHIYCRYCFCYIILFCLQLLFVWSCKEEPPEIPVFPPQPIDILEKLKSLPGIQVREVAPLYGYPRAFEIDLLQPLDYNNPEGQKFSQRIYLSHVGESMPMIFAPAGYGTSLQNVQEIAGILGTNHLSVAHRFFTQAQPSPINWNYLNVRQAAEDHHRIVTLFKTIYTNVWISSGVSKGGMTCLFHKKYFPDDVDATIAYVAPLEFGASDNRFPEYLNTIGDEECRNNVKDFQRLCLAERDSLIPRMAEWFSINGITVSRSLNLIFETQVTSYDWTFWQYHTKDCSEIPDTNSSFDEIFLHLAETTQLDRASDESFDYFKPYYFQAYTEIGYPARNYDHLMDLLEFTPDSLDHEIIQSFNIPITYNSTICLEVNNWLQSNGNNIIYIYGSMDPWTGGAVELTGGTNALKIIQTGADHTIKINGLDNPDIVLNTLEDWVGIEIISKLGKSPIHISEKGIEQKDLGLFK